MSNIMTGQLRMAKKIYAQGFLRFTHLLKARPSCDQVVFQDGNIIGLVDPLGEQQVRVRKGDIIIRVYRNAYSHQLVGTVITKDNYIRAYDLPLEITVSDPVRFASSYERNEDPARQAIDALKEAFEKVARKYEHHMIPQLELSFGSWSKAHLEHIGVHIEQRGKTNFHADPYHTEISLWEKNWRNQATKFREEQKIQKLQDEIKVERDAFLLEEEQRAKAKQREFERQEKTKDQLYDISSNLRKVAADEIAKVLKERIIEGFARGHNPGAISHEYFALVGIFQSHNKHTELDKSIIKAGSFVDGSVNHQAKDGTQSPMSSSYPEADDSTS